MAFSAGFVVDRAVELVDEAAEVIVALRSLR